MNFNELIGATTAISLAINGQLRDGHVPKYHETLRTSCHYGRHISTKAHIVLVLATINFDQLAELLVTVTEKGGKE